MYSLKPAATLSLRKTARTLALTTAAILCSFTTHHAQAMPTQLQLPDGSTDHCFANGSSESSAINQFVTLCGSEPISCALHRGQYLCASTQISSIDVAPVTNAPETDPIDDPFVSGFSVVTQWNELALAAIRDGSAKPTVTAYQLFMLSTTMYDAYAAHSPVAVPVYFQDNSQDPALSDTTENKREAISQAAYKSLVFLFPKYENRYGYFYRYLTELGYSPVSGYEPASIDTASPSSVGYNSVVAYLQAREFDGSNFRDNFQEQPSLIYPHPYVPVNNPNPADSAGEFGDDFDPNHWQPLRVPNGTLVDEEDIPVFDSLNLDSFGDQQYLSPHWGGVTPFALSHGAELRPVPPPLFGSEEPYTDALGVTSTNTEAYVRQIEQVIEFSANLDDRGKLMAEFWADGPRTESPPGHWNQLAHGLVERDDLSMDESIEMFFTLNAGLLDASIATWEAKRHYDYIRPASAIRWYFQGQTITAWGGPDQGAQAIAGESWSPYQKLDFVTPPFPEYVSGHSTFSRASAEVLTRFLGSGQFYDGQTRTLQDVNGDGELDFLGQHIALPGDFEIENGPEQPEIFNWPTFIDAADEAGISRLHGGIHIQDGDLRGRALGEQIGIRVFEKAQQYFNGTVSDESG